ncbi:MAG: hypothetical protein K940chlam2_01690 [Chlamydiae bacterium]|nr:hypothetical protein [Chlamydiota bacterium]
MTNLDAATTAQLRLIKKYAIVLITLFILDRPAGSSEIARILEIDRNTASKYLKSAVDLGIVTRTHFHEGYQLTDIGRQLYLGLNFTPLAPVDKPVDNFQLLKKPTVDLGVLRKFSAVEPATALKTLKNLKDLKDLKAEADPPLLKNSAVNPQFDENLEELRKAGIYSPKNKELANLPHVTPEYVSSHAQKASKEGKGIGMLIYRIQEADPIQDSDGKYAGGEFSDFINQ